ncbi:MAG: response regulator transcription factor [Candidatus Omnitrophica bacterium]|nr:response regulator transcription factor [Candidatus Omnitrophota bacterium]MDE2008677.1 response regulator transcription factor [Candidatus Omnitrophota bacterium]MDE2214818.1 response regulator transcription factor [Candidatus Omnitrophota bacterium]MDE2231938.1 response regulator transcription factor [Candidatus Omnitrophota bacterium]
MKKKLLIVEDHDEFRAMLKGYISRHGLDLEIYDASTGETGLAKAASVKPDIVLMDINLPQANGLTIAKAIKESLPHCRIIFLTMFNVEVFKKAAEKIKAAGFISKDDVYERLVPVIKKCLEN